MSGNEDLSCDLLWNWTADGDGGKSPWGEANLSGFWRENSLFLCNSTSLGEFYSSAWCEMLVGVFISIQSPAGGRLGVDSSAYRRHPFLIELFDFGELSVVGLGLNDWFELILRKLIWANCSILFCDILQTNDVEGNSERCLVNWGSIDFVILYSFNGVKKIRGEEACVGV